MKGRGRPFLPGNQYGKGRPRKGQSIVEIIEALGMVDSIDEVDGTVKSRRIALVEKLWQLALGGDIAAIKYIIDKVDGFNATGSLMGSVSSARASLVTIEKLSVDEWQRRWEAGEI